MTGCRMAARPRPPGPGALALVALLLLALPGSALGARHDRDGDGLRDAWEGRWGVSSPDRRDSDRDGVVDSAEDPDGDRLGNLGEQRFGTDPGSRDSDGDGRSDGNDDSDQDGRRDARQQDERPVPAGLVPSLAGARMDRAGILRGCVAHQGSSTAVRCRFGAPDGPRTVVLMGDSHAMMWVLPVVRSVEREGWRLVTLLKGGCSPVLDTKWAADCAAWRRAALAWLQQHPPDLLVMAHSDDYRLVDRDGLRIPVPDRPAVWGSGMERTLEAIPGETATLLLGDVPDNHQVPALCLAQHPRDMSACQTARQPRAKRLVEVALREAALATDAMHHSLYDWVCTYDPCPLVQGRVLAWRDRSHITATLARRLSPSMRTLLAAAMPEARP
jgi:hypothetical protein